MTNRRKKKPRDRGKLSRKHAMPTAAAVITEALTTRRYSSVPTNCRLGLYEPTEYKARTQPATIQPTATETKPERSEAALLNHGMELRPTRARSVAKAITSVSARMGTRLVRTRRADPPTG